MMIPEPVVWITREGQALRPTQMTDSHIDNALRMALRLAQGYVRSEASATWRVAMRVNGDMAEFFVTRDAELLEEIANDPPKARRYVLSLPIIRALFAERSRRKRVARGKEPLF